MNDKIEKSTFDSVRRYRRITANIFVRVFLGTGQSTAARGHDIGVGGMAVYAPLEIARGTSLNLSFQLPHSKLNFGVRAIVRNGDGFRYGVEFVDLTPSEIEEINRVGSIMNAPVPESSK